MFYRSWIKATIIFRMREYKGEQNLEKKEKGEKEKYIINWKEFQLATLS